MTSKPVKGLEFKNGKWVRVHLTAQDGNAVLLPPHAGHAFQALTDNTIVCYLVTAEFNPHAEKGVTPLCPTLNIDWSSDCRAQLSEKDMAAPNLLEQRDNAQLPSR